MQYIAPQTTADVVAALAKSKGIVQLLAGGSDLLVRLKGGHIQPDLIIDIKHIKELQQIKKTANGFTIGASVSCAEMGAHKALRKAWPGLVESANLIGSDQIQNRCTIVGNLCNASPAADSVPAMIAANAQAVILGPRGERLCDVGKLVTAPGKNSLKKAEMVIAIQLPVRRAKSADAYLRFIPRSEMDIAVVGVAVELSINKGIIESARIALGAVAPTAILVPAAAKAIVGSKLSSATLEKLKLACQRACKPIDDKRGTVAYRTKVAGVLAVRAAQIAYERAGGKC